MRVLLTGFMGAGKTTVGRRLAERLGYPFFDLDEVIAGEAGSSVRDIFERQGEETFRRLERLALEKTLQLPEAVVATGGGTLVAAESAEQVRGHAISVWLNTPLEVIERRLGSDSREDRPLYGQPSAMRDLRRRRLPAYRQADIRLDIGGDESVDEVVNRLIAMLEEVPCATS